MAAGERQLVSIGHAAALVGAHPQTLREYERQGLLTPQRTPGGTRRYGQAELERLVRIQQLSAEGVGLSGVRYVLELEDRLERAHARIAELETHLGIRPAGRATMLATRSMSLELVHVPRARRSPRWRNQD